MSQPNNEVKKVLFVCLGNICRSPIAEAVFQHLLKERHLQDRWVSDSAATSAKHVGSPPNHRAQLTLKKHSIKYTGKARLLEELDFFTFDFIFGMDENNLVGIRGAARDCGKAKIMLLGDFDPDGERIIRDPYFDSGADGFEKCLQQCKRCCSAFLNQHS